MHYLYLHTHSADSADNTYMYFMGSNLFVHADSVPRDVSPYKMIVTHAVDRHTRCDTSPVIVRAHISTPDNRICGQVELGSKVQM